MISLLVTVLVFALVCYLIFWIMGFLGAPEPIRKVVTVIVVVIAAIWLISNFAPLIMTGGPHPLLR
jgi:hypothetical protein